MQLEDEESDEQQDAAAADTSSSSSRAAARAAMLARKEKLRALRLRINQGRALNSKEVRRHTLRSRLSSSSGSRSALKCSCCPYTHSKLRTGGLQSRQQQQQRQQQGQLHSLGFRNSTSSSSKSSSKSTSNYTGNNGYRRKVVRAAAAAAVAETAAATTEIAACPTGMPNQVNDESYALISSNTGAAAAELRFLGGYGVDALELRGGPGGPPL
ncbi:hypothetical protein ACSSS7_008363 [Eimeria intestinalis]